MSGLRIRGLPRLRSLRNKLALLFFGVTALAFAVVIFVLLPQLQTRLEEQKLENLEQVVEASSPRLQQVMGQQGVTGPELDELVRAVADATDARVTVLGRQESSDSGQALFYPISDSNADPRVRPNYRLAERTVERGHAPGQTVSIRGDQTGEVAKPLYYRGSPDWVAIYSRSFDDTDEVVGIVRDRLLLASAAALLVALIGGYLVARALARRVRRLERAADALAAGERVDPLPIDSADELGRLTPAFNEMQEQLQRVERARREFIANASHELRTPLFSLGGFVELLEDEQLDRETRREFLGSMAEQVERLQKLAVDLLDLSRLDAGSLELTEEDVDISELAYSVAAEFRPVVSQNGTELELRLPNAPVAVRCDRQRVAQIMRILLDNALRHTPEGTHVTVIADSRNGAAEFAVADTGPGVDAGSRAQLFERFYTGDAASGSGLGLAIAKELAERMHGRIDVRSRPGETVFTLALPTTEDDGE
jgi:two-component system OmpR family sensor kinase